MSGSPRGIGPSDVAHGSARGRPAAGSGRGARAAVAGFGCALVSVMASLFADVLAAVPLPRRLGPALQRLHDAVVPGATSGEGMLLFTAAFLLACVAFALSFHGRRSHSRRGLALLGMLLSALVAVCFCLIVAIVAIGWSQAFRYGTLPGNHL